MSQQDLHARGLGLYFPRFSGQLRFFLNSPFQHQREIGRRTREEELYYDCGAQCPFAKQQSEILERGPWRFLKKIY